MPLKWNNTITTVAGTTTAVPIVIPNGTLTTTTQNGAIERDSNGVLWETHSGKRTQLVSTRFSKNVDQRAGSNIFLKYNSVFGDIIAAGNISGLGKIYPSGLNSDTGMRNGDIIESSIIVYRNSNLATADYVLRIEFWKAVTSGGKSDVGYTYNYKWDTALNPTLSLKIIFTKRGDYSEYGYLNSYVVLINGVFVYSTSNFYSWDKADCRLLLVNNNPGTNTIIFNQYQATNLFIPISSTL